MAKGYVLKYADEVVCATERRDLLVIYLHQKGVRRFNHYYSIERIPRKEIPILYDDYELFEHDETGMIVTPDDLNAWSQRMEQLEMMYNETLMNLQNIKLMLTKKKDLKKLDDAIDVIKKRKAIITGKEGKIEEMAEVLGVPIETILQERELFRGFAYAVQKED